MSHTSLPSDNLPPLDILHMGCIGYGEALDFQKSRVASRIDNAVNDSLLVLEHKAVITMGRGGSEADILVSQEELRRHGVEVFWTERGGMATYHGPGQLVIYPIITLQDKDLHLFMDKMLNVLESTVRAFGLNPQRRVHGPGIWVDNAKIASIGIAVRKWVTFHGIALNVNTDTRAFSMITPCGNPTERITSMQDILGYAVDIDSVAQHFIDAFAREFSFFLPPKLPIKRPPWLTVTLPSAQAVQPVEHILTDLRIHTVCEEAVCPNKGECFARGTSTFMIMGDICTRNCRYCAVGKGNPLPLDTEEPHNVARAVQRMGLQHAVITSVTRDDVADGGATHFVCTIEAIRQRSPETSIEILVPDFQGDKDALKLVCAAHPDMFNHNIETVQRLFSLVRPKACYTTSLDVLTYAAEQGLRIKSGVMLGLGESWEEIRATLTDLYAHGCRFLTLGQYLAPSAKHVPVARYIAPDEFAHWKTVALNIGFTGVASAPLVRSSYRAEAMLTENNCCHSAL